MNMETPQFRAAMERWEHFTRIQQPFRIEGALQALLLIEVYGAEHDLHEVALLHADPVLARQHATDGNAELQDVGAKRLGSFKFARLVRIVEDERMQIAVSGMKDVGDPQSILLRHIPHPGQDLR